jgi:hypothetical protein
VSNPLPGPEHLLQGLERLRRLAEELSTEASLRLDAARQRENQAQLRARATDKAIDGQLETSRAEAAQRRDRSLEFAESRALRRTARIREAQRNARRTGLERLDAEEGKHKFELQRQMLRATRERDAGLAAADAALAAISATLDGAQGDLAALESRAQSLFGVYGRRVLTDLAQAHESARPDLQPAEGALAERLTSTLASLNDGLSAFGRRLLPRLSRAWPLWLALGLSPVLILPTLHLLRITSPSPTEILAADAAFLVLATALHLMGRGQSLPTLRELTAAIGTARVLLHNSRTKAADTHRAERARLELSLETTTHECNQGWARIIAWLEESRARVQTRADSRATRAIERNERLRQSSRQRIEQQFIADLEAAQTKAHEARAELARDQDKLAASAQGDSRQSQGDQTSRWRSEADPILTEIEVFQSGDQTPQHPPHCIPQDGWIPPATQTSAVRFGSLDLDLQTLLSALPPDLRDAPGLRQPRSLPLLLTFPHHGSLLLDTPPNHRTQAIGLLNQTVCRLLAGSPPGRVAFTLYDPVGLGQSFAGLTHLADETEHLIHGRIWTQPGQIEEKLSELNEHLEKVIQMYLRNEYATIAEYNQQAGNIAEKYRFVVLADFPAGFTDVALRRLLNLAATGARCGVFLLIHRDQRQPVPLDFPLAALRQACLNLTLNGPNPVINGRSIPGTTLHLDPAPETTALTNFIRRVARANLDSNRVEVPFDSIAPTPDAFWTGDTASEIRVPIGRTGATKFQYLALGKATRQHALIAGKTGSGKSTLFHVLITNLALWCPPDQVQFYLVDFKKGVEFKCYATHRLPHARVVAIESDREFGLGVLQRLDDELRIRGEQFRNAQVQDLAAYRRSPGATPMPRLLLLVDEFQEFFVEEDRIAQNASVLLDRIVRQGRAFGIHVILGSQTLGGAYTVARTTLGQMVVRIALQCNEADAMLIMDEENPAPRLLSRPGEGIYNDAAGARSGNSPFQVVWLSDEVRDGHLRRIRQQAELSLPQLPGPLIYEGDAPADVRDNPDLQALLSAPSPAPSPEPRPLSVSRCWLGAPNSIKGPTQISFSRRSGDHLLIVGQRDDTLLAQLGITLLTLAAQHPRDTAEFVILDGSAADSPDRAFLDRLVSRLPHRITLARAADAGPALSQLGASLRTPANPGSNLHPTRFLFVHGLQNFRALRPEDEFAFGATDAPPSPAAVFKDLIHEGAAHGFHVIANCDTYNNVSRQLGRKSLGEFGLRVLFQMSANDSASLIDNPAASRLGFHRALLYQDREGSIEVFRPYTRPDDAWLMRAFDEITRLAS